MIKVLFICHGNICRSPMAEVLFRDLVDRAGLSSRLSVSSCATSAEEICNGVGNPVYPPARRELARHGLSCEGKRATQLRPQDYRDFDLLICMDSFNLRNALEIVGGDPAKKMVKLLSFSGEDRDVADPWYSGRFDVTYQDLLRGCTDLLEYLKDNVLK